MSIKNLKKTYYCPKCDLKFKAKGTKKEFNNPIYGVTWKWLAQCPECGQSVKQFKKQLSASSKDSRDTCQSNSCGIGANTSSCPTGTCPFA